MTKLWHGPDPIQVTVARAALAEVGVGIRIQPNRIGAPCRIDHPPPEQEHLAIQAFLLGHLAAGHQAVVKHGAIHCSTCNDMTERRLQEGRLQWP